MKSPGTWSERRASRRGAAGWAIAAALMAWCGAHAKAGEWRLSVRLSLNGGFHSIPGYGCHGFSGWPRYHVRYPYFPNPEIAWWSIGGSDSYWWRNTTYLGRPMWEVARKYDPKFVYPLGQAPPPPDEGLVALANGAYADALAVYAKRHAERLRREREWADRGEVYTADRRWQRLSAVAHLGARDFVKAERAFVEAYRDDPSLRHRPMLGAGLAASSGEWRRLVTLAIDHARRTGSGDAWFMASVMVQGEGRDNLARDLARRAASLGTEALAISGAAFDAQSGGSRQMGVER